MSLAKGEELPKGPLVSIEWSDVEVTATVLGLATSQTVAAKVFPKFEEKLPYRRGIRIHPKQLKPQTKTSPAAPPISNGTAATTPPAATGGSVGGGGVQSQGSVLKKCHICGRGFHKANYLKRHLESHSSVKPYKCEVCGWGFFQYSNLKRHMTSHNINSGSQGFPCSRCNASFSTKSVLTVHMRDTHGERVLQPNAGGPAKKVPSKDPPPQVPSFLPGGTVSITKTTVVGDSNNSSMNDSLDPSQKGQQYSCTICNAKFDKVSNLNKHIKIHSGT